MLSLGHGAYLDVIIFKLSQMRMIGLVLLTTLVTLLAAVLMFMLVRTLMVQNSPGAKIFLEGDMPEKMDGFYKGTVTGFKTDWQGKKIDSSKGMGINVFNKNGRNIESFPFKIYRASGLLDNIQVMRIDYDLPQNPLWVRFIKDEVVQTGPGKYLGKICISLLPVVNIGVGYFKLEK